MTVHPDIVAMTNHPLFPAFKDWYVNNGNSQYIHKLVHTPNIMRSDDTAVLFLWGCFLAGVKAGED